jgi:hypothetical protein
MASVPESGEFSISPGRKSLHLRSSRNRVSEPLAFTSISIEPARTVGGRLNRSNRISPYRVKRFTLSGVNVDFGQRAGLLFRSFSHLIGKNSPHCHARLSAISNRKRS